MTKFLFIDIIETEIQLMEELQMSVVITKEDLIAYTEVDYIIHHMNEKYVNKLPKNLLNFFDTIQDPEYEIYVDPHKPLQNQGLQKYTLEIIALLHVKYWCEDPERKEELLGRMKENQMRFETQWKEKISTDEKFQNQKKDNEPKESEEDPMVTAFSKYTAQNPDIQDYTDIREEPVTEELTETVQEEGSFLKKLKSWITKIFKKSAE